MTLLLLLVLVIGGAAFLYFADPLGLFSAKAPPAPAQTPTPPAPATPEVAAPVPEATPAPEQPPPQTIAPPPEPETPPEPEPEPVVEQDPMVANAIRALQVSGARANSSGGTIMLGTRVFMAGEVINRDLGITFVRFEDGQFTFRDERGAVYQRKF